MNQGKKITLGLIAISVIMFFVALATDIFWIGKWAAKAFPKTMPVPDELYNAFALPDLVLSVLLFVGAIGLLRLGKLGFAVSLVALGMWLFDSLLVLGLTRLTLVSIVGPSLLFDIFALGYLWSKRELFIS